VTELGKVSASNDLGEITMLDGSSPLCAIDDLDSPYLQDVPNRRGLCYLYAGKMAAHAAASAAYMVIGKVSQGKRIAHAWVELGEAVYDPQYAKWIQKDLYYEDLKAVALYRLTGEEVQAFGARTSLCPDLASIQRYGKIEQKKVGSL
jgi:hypothetical protein